MSPRNIALPYPCASQNAHWYQCWLLLISKVCSECVTVPWVLQGLRISGTNSWTHLSGKESARAVSVVLNRVRWSSLGMKPQVLCRGEAFIPLEMKEILHSLLSEKSEFETQDINSHEFGGQQLCCTVKILISYLLVLVSLKEIHFKVSEK